VDNINRTGRRGPGTPLLPFRPAGTTLAAILACMTTYAYDTSVRHVIACCAGGAGSTAHTVARLHERTGQRLGLRLADQLTLLSSEAWLSYTDGEGAGPVPEVAALAAVRSPNLPRDGRLRVERNWVVERAHEVGRTLAEIGSAGVRRAVVDDVADELASVRRALHGDLRGRAGQAVELTRLDASPTQVAVADRLLDDVPAGGEALRTDVEPTAACVASAHWLAAAVAVTVRLIGGTGSQDVLDPDEATEPFDVVAPRLVVDLIMAGQPPLVAVQRLVRPAMLVARGFVPTDEECDVPGLVVLDPTRPARHLLDRLMHALRTCLRVYVDHLDPGILKDASDPIEAGGREFDREVRHEAALTADRLTSSFQTC
jgi:hypothetical protein